MAPLHPLGWAVARAPMLPVAMYPDEAPDPRDLSPIARSALRLASPDLVEALTRSPVAPRARQKLLAYLIRMSTRPTPYGLFAGVALVEWGERTDVAVADEPPRTHARADMAPLLELVARLERNDDIRRRLRVFTNPEALIAAGRAFLGTRVSVRATPAVRRALTRALTPIRMADLADDLLELPGASPERVQSVLDELWRQSLLLTELRPPLTVPDPAGYVSERLGAIGVDERPGAATQIDAELPLERTRINRSVAEEAARAAELLLRLSPDPRGRRLERYRRRFVERYGLAREIPLLELLHPELGLGPPGEPPRSHRRRRAVHELALAALRERRHTVELDDALLARLETCDGTPPASLELCVLVAAASAEALDEGDFKLIVGPNVGADQAGRGLGRFAELLGAEQQLAEIAGAVELVYLPPDGRAANVALRPAAAAHQIVCATTPAPGARTIPLHELAVGVHDDRFFVRWTASGDELQVSEQHMLNPLHAPPVIRFLRDAARDGRPAFTGFDWGPAWEFPFLPRVQRGRIVLSPAQWRIDVDELAAWDLPRHVYLADGDNRLLLDLHAAAHRELLRDHRTVVLQEALPGLDDAWLPGADGTRMLELVVPLVSRRRDVRPPLSPPPAASGTRLKPPGSEWLFLKLYCPPAVQDDMIAEELLPFAAFARAGLADGWFFIRYADPDAHLRIRFHGEPETLLERLLPEACAVANRLVEQGSCSRFAFDTYERELERYGGEAGLRHAESIFARDSDVVCELLALARRRPDVDVTTLAVVSVEALLDGLGLSAPERLRWYAERVSLTSEDGREWRRRKTRLRALLAATGAAEPELAHQLRRLRFETVPAEQLESFVHMHCNRLIGARPELEELVLRLARRARDSLAHAPL